MPDAVKWGFCVQNADLSHIVLLLLLLLCQMLIRNTAAGQTLRDAAGMNQQDATDAARLLPSHLLLYQPVMLGTACNSLGKMPNHGKRKTSPTLYYCYNDMAVDLAATPHWQQVNYPMLPRLNLASQPRFSPCLFYEMLAAQVFMRRHSDRVCSTNPDLGKES